MPTYSSSPDATTLSLCQRAACFIACAPEEGECRANVRLAQSREHLRQRNQGLAGSESRRSGNILKGSEDPTFVDDPGNELLRLFYGFIADANSTVLAPGNNRRRRVVAAFKRWSTWPTAYTKYPCVGAS